MIQGASGWGFLVRGMAKTGGWVSKTQMGCFETILRKENTICLASFIFDVFK